MTTKHQKLGKYGEKLVVKYCECPKCKKPKTIKQLIQNFKCADIICDFCGFLGQVKAKRVTDVDIIPSTILGAAWWPQKERMEAGNFFSLYLVLIDENNEKNFTIYFLPSELQELEMFVPRKPLGPNARRAGWQGYIYKLTDEQKKYLVKLYPKRSY